MLYSYLVLTTARAVGFERGMHSSLENFNARKYAYRCGILYKTVGLRRHLKSFSYHLLSLDESHEPVFADQQGLLAENLDSGRVQPT
jgi:hypothetical protein